MVVLEKGATSYGAFVPDLPGCVAVSETENEAMTLIQEASGFHLEDLTAAGMKLPVPAAKSAFVDVPFEFVPNMPLRRSCSCRKINSSIDVKQS